MQKVIQNINGKATVKTIFRGREIVLKPKHSLTLDLDNEEDKALYRHLLSIYSFVIDRTAIISREPTVDIRVPVQNTFQRKLIKFLEKEMPRDYLKRVTYSDTEIIISFGEKR